MAKQVCTLKVTDEDGNTVTMLIDAEAEIHDWMVALARILKWHEFHPDSITANLGDF